MTIASWSCRTFISIYALAMTGVCAANSINDASLDLEVYCPRGQQCPVSELSGSWGFHKGGLLSASDIYNLKPTPHSSESIVPSAWNAMPVNPFADSWQDAIDVGTYWIEFKNFGIHHAKQQLALQLRSIFTSYRVLWVPLEPRMQEAYILYERGWNQLEPLSSEGNLLDQFLALPYDHGTSSYLLVIQVANGIHSKGGMRQAPQLGVLSELQAGFLTPQIFNGFLIGAIAIIAIYHLLIFLQRREDRGAFWLAVECVFIALFVMCRRGIFEHLTDGPSNLMMSIRTHIEYATHIFAPIAFSGFLIHTFPSLRSKIFQRSMMICGLAGLLIMLTPMAFFTRLYLTFFIPTMVYLVVLCWVQMLRHYQDHQNLKMTLLGSTLLGAAAINDAISSAGLISSVPLLDYAQVGLILLQGSILSHLFAEAYQLAKTLSSKLQAEVERQTRDIKAILLNIKQGIFTAQGERLLIGEQRSDFLKQILPEQTNSFVGYLEQYGELSSDHLSQITETIKACQSEDELNFECNRHLLPREIQITKSQGDEPSILEIDWSPMCDANDQVEKFLIVIRDVTELRSLQEASRQQEENLRILAELLKIPENRFRRFTRKVHDYLQQNSVLIDSLDRDLDTDKQEIVRQLFMNMHTIKGTARSLHLKAIAAISHDVEQYYAHLKQDARQAEAERLYTELKMVKSTLQRYETLGRDTLGWQLDDEQVKVSRQILLDAVRSIAELVGEGSNPSPGDQTKLIEICETFETLTRSSLEDTLHDMCYGLDSTARDLNKEPPIVSIDSPGFMLNDDGHDLIQAAFTHILRNAIDHGLEEADVRTTAGKPPQGRIEIECRQLDDHLRIRCQDDGRGLSLQRIWQKACDQGIAAGEAPDRAIEIAELIFHPGLTTKDRATEISGRGVGMDAVKTYLQRCGGNVQIELTGEANKDGFVPFQIIIDLPPGSWWQKLSNTSSLPTTLNQAS